MFTRNIITLDIGSSSIKIAEFSKSGKNLFLKRVHIEDLLDIKYDTENLITGKSVISSFLVKIWDKQKFKSKDVITVISRQLAVVKQINVPTSDKERISKIISVGLESYVPFKSDEVVWDYKIISVNDNGSSDIFLFVARKDDINKLIRTIESAGLHCIEIGISSSAILSAYTFAGILSDSGNALISHLGDSTTEINIISNGKLILTRSTSIGGSKIKKSISTNLNISDSEADALLRRYFPPSPNSKSDEKNEIVSNLINVVLKQLIFEFNFTIDSIKAKNPNFRIDFIIISGGLSQLYGIDKFISDQMRIPVIVADPLSKINCDFAKMPPSRLKEISPVLVTNIGLALSFIGLTEKGVNLLPLEITKKRSIQKRNRQIAQLSIIILLALSIVLTLFIMRLNRKEKELAEIENNYRKLQHQASEVQKMKQDINFLRRIVEKKTSWLDVMREMSIIVPEGVNINDLTFQRRNITSDLQEVTSVNIATISGETKSNSDLTNLLSALNNSPYFDSVTLQYADRKSISEESSIVEFKITATIVIPVE